MTEHNIKELIALGESLIPRALKHDSTMAHDIAQAVKLLKSLVPTIN